MSAWYRTGTITSSGNVITGTGTRWTDNKMGIGAGQMLIVPGDGIVQMYEILFIDSDTQLRLVTTPAEPLSGIYAIVSFYTDSIPDFARRLAAQMSYYQSQMDGWQQILTGTGSVTIIAPDGSEVIIPSLSSMMPKSGGTFTGPVVLSGNATAALNPITKQQFDVLNNDAFTATQVIDTPWVTPTLINGWEVVPGYRARYRKVLGMVFIEAVIQGAGSSIVAFTLPEGYRPSSFVIAPISGYNINTSITPTAVIYADGRVMPQGLSNNLGIRMLFNYSLE